MRASLTDHWILLTLLALTLLVLALLAVVVIAARSASGAGDSSASASNLGRSAAASLRLSFRRAVALIEANLAARGERYNLSWTLLLNEGTEAGLALRAAGLPSALSTDATLNPATQGIAWHFFDKGVVVQLRADYLGAADDKGAGNGLWDELLSLCRRYRPQRPFDCIVLALPCSSLLGTDAAGQIALVARAKAIHRRLWLAQNRLALRVPIHLVISGCEAVPGFAAFGAALPDPLRRSMLGWASPYELVAPFRIQWVDDAVHQMVGAVADRCAELGALEQPDADSSAYFLLPSELARLRAGLTLFCDELMRPSAYHESFLLRGIYLTGDCSAAAVLVGGTAGQAAAPADASLANLPAAGLATPTAAVLAAGEHAMQALAQHEVEPVFLRDLFERKIFAEVGLVRASARRTRGAPGGSGARLLYWSALAVPAVWAVGLVVATIELQLLGQALVKYLDAFGHAPANTANIAPEQRQQSALAALDGYEQLDGARFRSFYMPGSWALFDPLHERLQLQLEQDFSNSALGALREALSAKVSGLTGVERDPVGGHLVPGGRCTRPLGWDDQVGRRAARDLNMKDLPEYSAMNTYLERVEELARVVDAIGRLAGPSDVAASGADLALVVKVLLKKDMSALPTRAAALFRAAAQGEQGARDGQLVAQTVLQSALGCTLEQASDALFAGLFDRNPLLLAEREVAARTAALMRDGAGAGASAADSADATPLAHWQALRRAMDDEQQQLVAVRGGWMAQSEMKLGTNYENLLKRIRNNRLLGRAAEDSTDARAREGFGRFKMAWQQAVDAPSPLNSGGPGLTWTGNEQGWTFTPERAALHATVVTLMTAPYLAPALPARLAAVPAGSSVLWDAAQLERAASLADARKTFRSGVYVALPVVLQESATTLVDSALAASAHSTLSQALSVIPAELPNAASDASRVRVLRIREWLGDIGAHALADQLDTVVARDALSRLERLDALLARASLYQPADVTLQSWQGQKGAMLGALGGGDAAGLAAYLEQQQEFIDTAVAQAEGVLSRLHGPAAAHPLVARWQALAADQRRYLLKSPTSSRMALEQFIVAGSADIDTNNCAERLAVSPRRAADLFGERLRSLQGAMLARCRALVLQQGQQAWQQFAVAYNQDLGRRAPFVVQPSCAAPPRGGEAGPAERDTVGSVLGLYDRVRTASAPLERDVGQPGTPPAVRQAQEQLRRMRALLAPLYPADDGQASGLDVTLQFRANSSAEIDASTIIDWSLTIGSASVRQADAARALRWEPGMPVLLTLRLARDGNAIPKAGPGAPCTSVNEAERTIAFRFDDPWALLTLIGSHRDADSAGEIDAPVLLRFDFPVRHAGMAPATSPAPPAPDSRVRVFLRLKLSAPGKRTALAWPAVFPSTVPLWQ